MARGGVDTAKRPIKTADNWKGGKSFHSADPSLTRLASYEVDPSRASMLRVDHPALFNATTIFPSTVVSPSETPRLLVSGHNNAKLGAEIRKGPWAGMPVFQLTLEERATCPRSCLQWRSCYGSAMHRARRHAADGDLLEYLAAELLLLNREHKQGFVVRLHTLGDFYSLAYVDFWRVQIERLPRLHVFGYTAYLPEAENPGEAAIGKAVSDLTDDHWARFAIRFSGRDGAQGTIVVNEDPKSEAVIVCPAQKEKTMACATCGLCWSDGARAKTVAFLRHGMKSKAGMRYNVKGAAPETKALAPTPYAKLKAAPNTFGRFTIAPSWRRQGFKNEGVTADERAMIDAAIAEGRVTECTPGYAFGASPGDKSFGVGIGVAGRATGGRVE